jgi:hypothetical protein
MIEFLEQQLRRAMHLVAWLIFGIFMLIKLVIECFKESPVETAVVLSGMAIGSYVVWWTLDVSFRFLSRTCARIFRRLITRRFFDRSQVSRGRKIKYR